MFRVRELILLLLLLHMRDDPQGACRAWCAFLSQSLYPRPRPNEQRRPRLPSPPAGKLAQAREKMRKPMHGLAAANRIALQRIGRVQADGRQNCRLEGAVPEASRDKRAHEQQNVPRIGKGQCAGGRDSRLGRGRGARYR